MKVLITGDRGFVGTETRRFFETHALSFGGYDLMDNRDILDLEQLKVVVKTESITRILHLAAVARFSEADDNARLAYRTNVEGTRNIAAVASLYHIPVVYASTGSVYMPIKRNPPITEEFPAIGNSSYGCSKFVGEEYIRGMAAPWIILRYAHLYGKEKRGHGLIGGFMERIERGLAPTLYGGNQSNDFTYIKDVAKANYLAVRASADKWNQIYNIGTGEELSAQRAGELVCEISGYRGTIEVEEGRTVDPQRFVFDTTKAESWLGFKAAYSFEAGLRDMLGA